MLRRSYALRTILCAVISGWLGGCAIVDNALSPRTYSINEGADAVLNNTILLNILRASSSEPLNFVAIAKYTGAGQLGLNAQAGQFIYAAQAIHPASQYGPNTISGQVNGSFDLNVLETKDFYTGLLRGMDASQTGVWFSQGLTRELVFYVLIASIRTTAPDGAVYEYRNDPADDDWHRRSSNEEPEHNSQVCIPKADDLTKRTQFDYLEMWYGLHENDCRFQKFRFLVDLAVKYGLRTETVTIPNPKWTKASTTEPKTLSKFATCYDPALFREFVHKKLVPGLKVCGNSKSVEAKQFSIRGPGTLTGVELVVRSPFAIFQYLGRILATDSQQQVVLKGRERTGNESANPQVLTVVSGFGPSCFAEAWYHGASYCVPMEGTENTKQIFTLLRAVLATNIAATDLNATPTIRVTP
jgi:hypothetical protein